MTYVLQFLNLCHLIMKYVIVGGGPTGLSLAWVLAHNNIDVTVIEQSDTLGGSWKSNWRGKYWVENAPRVLFRSGMHMKFLQDVGMEESDFKTVYGNMFQTYTFLFEFFMDHLSMYDIFQVIQGCIYYTFHDDDSKTLDEWITEKNISQTGERGLAIFSITLNDVPKNTNAKAFFNTLGVSSGGGLIQMTEPNKWHEQIECQLEGRVTFLKNTIVKGLEWDENTERVRACQCMDALHATSFQIEADMFVLCTQSSGIESVLKGSHARIQNNWGNLNDFQYWNMKTHYHGFGFQLHFQEKVDTPDKWCWACQNDWTIIVLKVSDWLKTPSLDPSIQTVWSCVVVDMNTKSQRVGKTLNECNRDEALDECMYQLKYMHNTIPTPYHISTSIGLKKQDGVWVSQNTGFTKSNQHYLPMKGDIVNIAALGCFTDTGVDQVASMMAAVESSATYLNTYEPHMVGFHIQENGYSKWVVFIFIVCIIFYLRYKR